MRIMIISAQSPWPRPQDVGHGDLVVVVVISEGALILPQLMTSNKLIFLCLKTQF